MSSFVYLFALLGALGGLAILDAKYRLVFWKDARRTLRVIGLGLALFLAWDILGVSLDIFTVGDGRIMNGAQILPNLPIEEPIFLLLLIYQTLMIWEGLRRWHAR